MIVILSSFIALPHLQASMHFLKQCKLKLSPFAAALRGEVTCPESQSKSLARIPHPCPISPMGLPLFSESWASVPSSVIFLLSMAGEKILCLQTSSPLASSPWLMEDGKGNITESCSPCDNLSQFKARKHLSFYWNVRDTCCHSHKPNSSCKKDGLKWTSKA